MVKVLLRVCLLGALAAPLVVVAENDLPTQFTNMGSVLNTRHNLQQTTEQLNAGGSMNPYRNRYGQVCVYCHTPHGANTNTAAPLWNRVVGNASYTLYTSSSINGVVNDPGASSLPCLSCHDGTQAVDAIMNMPGSGGYSTTANPAGFLPSLNNTVANAIGQVRSTKHMGLAYSMTSTNPTGTANTVGTGTNVGCMACHAPDGGPVGLGLGVATDFSAFYIGTDLKNDHPIGVAYPTDNGAGTDWKTPSGTKVSAGVTITYFDESGAGSGRLDKGDIRLFGSGSDARVECASCHDPHGVPSGAAGSEFLPTFLRKPISASGVCLTCHAK